ncbi:hypothetical protein PV04_00963 [Phialophora macrospora]|uniref:DUF1746 domain-containing protein n=1 Tax=Phialophora macrospora TaxID=1851006 RepID=A0A0D2FWD6_9EURO|nr:hypothetical protein PV04_00963 [Phialophora macrospora]
MACGNAETDPQGTNPPAPMNSTAGYEQSPSEDNSPLFCRLLQMNPLLLLTTILNPVLVLHSINGFLSLLYPDVNPYSIFDTSIQPHIDVHAQDGFCRLFTVVMVVLQSVLYSSHVPKITFPDSTREHGDDGHSDT